jgi:hypothetical protein
VEERIWNPFSLISRPGRGDGEDIQVFIRAHANPRGISLGLGLLGATIGFGGGVGRVLIDFDQRKWEDNNGGGVKEVFVFVGN